MFAEPYSSRVLELAADVAHVGALAEPEGRAHRVSRLCGSQVTVDLNLADDVIVDFAIEPKACALGQASASVLANAALGAKADEVIAARDALKAMLKDKGDPPSGRFWELRHLAAVADYPPRHASTLLAFEAAVDAIHQARARTK
jgi:NifU-like protein involved in Fe-S cluster formation